MSSLRQIALLRLCFLLFLSSATQPLSLAAVSAEAIASDASGSSIVQKPKNGAALLDQLIVDVNNLGSYKFYAAQEAQTGNKVLKATGTFYYKPASSVRVEVNEYGSKSGSILVKSPEGIKGKGGPAMFGFKMNLQPDSRLLKMPNGLSAVECDLGSLLKRLKRDGDAGFKMITGNEPVQVESLGARAIVLESQKTENTVTDRVFIDPVKKLPLQWDMYENGKLQSRSKFRTIEANVQLDDSQFKL